MKDRQKKPFNYMTLVGIIFLVVVLIALVNMLRTSDSGTVGIGQVGIGDKAAPFAVPLAISDLDGDANVDPGEACSVEGADVLRICDYFDRPLVMSFWFTKGASSCIDQQDIFDQVAARYRAKAGFVSINVRDDRDRVRELIRDHGWKVPVGYDRDGAVSNIYRVGGCPTFLFFRKGGVLEDAEIGSTDTQELGAQVRSLIDGESKATQQESTSGADPGSAG
ncbi:MAG: TlpA family protein disulfide reductase [Solirubrobacterales bacterium]|nr:TlpA family protein disulfide reductase [Solirubrobacterales bacterium]MCB0859943.1 TlpA family protein disulfide reductase [Solirubrobacterales bacterium]